MRSSWIWIVVAVLVIGGGYWYWQSMQAVAPLSDDGRPAAIDAADDAQANQTPAAPADTSVGVGANVSAGTVPMSATVTYNGSSYSPSTVTIKQGGSVTFTSAAGNMWVASAPHPEHTGYDGTSRSVHCAAGYTGAASFDQCSAGTSYTFTFNKVGTWPYHNHVNSGAFGKVIVQ